MQVRPRPARPRHAFAFIPSRRTMPWLSCIRCGMSTQPRSPSRSRIKNQMWYGVLGGKEMMLQSCKNLQKTLVGLSACNHSPLRIPISISLATS